MDRILMRGMEFFGHHGVFEEERVRGQKFIVDVEAFTRTVQAAESDDLRYTVDYGKLYERVRDIVEKNSFKLLETLAENIASEVMKETLVYKTVVRVRKPEAPLPGKFEYMAVEIVRERGNGI